MMFNFASRPKALRGKLLVAAAVLVCLPAAAVAELPPWVYREQQEKSPERLTIKVKSVKTAARDERDRKRTDVTVEAEVVRVGRTATRLKPGRVIRIRYTHSDFKQPIAGPSQIPILREGQTYPAFLSKSKEGNTYAPAAGGYSFRVVEAERK